MSKQSYPEKQTFQLQQAMQDCLQSFKCIEKYRHVSLRLVDDIVEPLTLAGNDQILKQVYDIILPAAAEYVGATKILVSVKQLLQAEKEVLLEFEVSDNGPGISNNSKKNFFSYKRLMAEARTLISQYGGKSVINSLYGVGTTFKFLLKFSTLQVKDARHAAPLQLGGLAGKKVLVAEDNELNQKAITHLLKKEGVLVDVAGDGREAVELFEKNNGYDLMLLDLQLPLMDGFQSAVYIRKKLKSNVPIIALTGGYYANAKARCFEIGINSFIQKPLLPAELISSLNYFLINKSA